MQVKVLSIFCIFVSTERSQTQPLFQIWTSSFSLICKLFLKNKFLKLLQNSIYLFLSNDLECGRIFEVLGLAFVDGRVVRLPFLSSHLLHVVPLSPNLYKQISITSLIQQIREETRFNYLQNLWKTIFRDVKRWNKVLVLPKEQMNNHCERHFSNNVTLVYKIVNSNCNFLSSKLFWNSIRCF
jgi:hypothetical protein